MAVEPLPGPEAMMRNFTAVSEQPRVSGHVDDIIAFLLAWAADHGIEAHKDDAGNVFMIRPGPTGAQIVCFQCHSDMVGVCFPKGSHNFETESIVPTANEARTWIRSRDRTTLGADDGAGMAACMALATDKELKNVGMELLFTANEETDMSGVKGFASDKISAKYIINCDAEDVGVVINGSAGGETHTMALDPDVGAIEPGDFESTVQIRLSGLAGGHSGLEISKGRANAISILALIIKLGTGNYGGRLASWKAGTAHNAIPSSGDAVILFPAASAAQAFKLEGDKLVAHIRESLAEDDRNLQVVIAAKDGKVHAKALGEKGSILFPEAVLAIKTGVTEWKPSEPPKPREPVTSENVAVVEFDVERMGRNDTLIVSVRSVFVSGLDERLSELKKVADAYGVLEYVGAGTSRYPPWEPETTPLLEMMLRAYRKAGVTEPTVSTVHAGLECSVLKEKYPKAQIIAIGPTIVGAHSIEERLEVSSCDTFYEALKKVATEIGESRKSAN